MQNKQYSQTRDTIRQTPFTSVQKQQQPNGKPPQLQLNGGPFLPQEDGQSQQYHRTPYHQLEKGDSTTQSCSDEFLNIPLEEQDDHSDIVGVDGKKVQSSADVRLGILGVILIIIAACFLVISAVVSFDPWNSMKG